MVLCMYIFGKLLWGESYSICGLWCKLSIILRFMSKYEKQKTSPHNSSLTFSLTFEQFALGFTFTADIVGRWHCEVFKPHRISRTQVVGWGKKTVPREDDTLNWCSYKDLIDYE